MGIPECEGLESWPDEEADYSEAAASSRNCVPTELSGLRLDQVLARLWPQHSRSRLQDWVRDGHVSVAGDTCREVRRKVWAGEILEVVEQPGAQQSALQAEAIPLDLRHEDADILILAKPAGLVVHPGSGNWSGTLLNGLLHYLPQARELPRAGIVHRLDKDTSGLMVVAKTLAAQTDLVRQLAARSVKRHYLALASGRVAAAGTVDAPIGRHPQQRTRMAVVQGGKPARTHYSVLEYLPAASLLRCELDTGRTHQIRVHMASLGHPLLGDQLYAERATAARFGRQALHACRLELLHPRSGLPMHWELPLPDDMAALLQRLRAERDTKSV
ncbi:MAG: 23S rRNA pseudouridine(1911/1915/1917) synthase RluD [Rhodocyclaceae bacterium]|nr:23S rRNA pseudouridine(1911/1915/1917) synthase RluD [Rhodocyclaceae bacterium]MBX3666889.1 23S rRNA pseudouridine(1911/1915/1917) synthase RluD [Rhodocyclaceae bacterium]